jgi:serine/threonine protein kinase
VHSQAAAEGRGVHAPARHRPSGSQGEWRPFFALAVSSFLARVRVRVVFPIVLKLVPPPPPPKPPKFDWYGLLSSARPNKRQYENIMFENKFNAGESSAGGVIGGGGGIRGGSRRLEIKVIDFGLSKKYGRGRDMSSATMSEFVGTIYTIAPEVLGGKYTL